MSNNLMNPKNLRWITVYLFLGLMVLLLALNLFLPGASANNSTPTPTATSRDTVMNCQNILHLTCTKVIGTVNAAKPMPILDTNKTTFTIKGNNPADLSTGKSSAVTYLEQQIKIQINQQGKQKLRAGIAIVYGGAMSNQVSQGQAITQAQNIASEVYKVLDILGQQKFVFCHTTHYDTLYNVGLDPGTVVIDVFFFDQSAGSC